MQCKCGCGQETALADRTRRGHRRGEPLDYVHGHNRRKYHGPVDRARCSTCKRDLLAEEFYQDKSRPTGLSSRCKTCLKRVVSTAHFTNREVRLAAMAEYRRRPGYLEKRPEYQRRWEAKDPDHVRRLSRNRQQNRRTRLRDAFDEVVDAFAVYDRDDGICGICKKRVSRESFHLDHVIPLAQGGRHSYANVQIAHPFCNIAKGGRLQKG